MPIKEGYCQTDTGEGVFKAEDTFWLVPPGTGEDGHDPGVLGAKTGANPVPRTEYWEEENGSNIQKIFDLLYCRQDQAEDILKLYPNAIMEEATDEIHTERFSLEVEDTKRNYYKNIIKTGLGSVSLIIQTAISTFEELPILKSALQELSDEKNIAINKQKEG